MRNVATAIMAGLCCLAFDCRTFSAETDPPETARAMFFALGVDGSYFDQFADGPPVADGETESIMRILFRLRIFPPVDLQRFARGEKTLADACSDPQKYRSDIYLLRGHVADVEPISPNAEAAQRYELARYYLCRMKLESGRAADVYVEKVPDEWQNGAKPDADAGAFAVFLKRIGDEKDATPVFAAHRLAWYPDNTLGRLGMDFGLLDSVVDRQPITAADREAFFQMLAAVGRASPDQLAAEAKIALPTLSSDLRWTDRDGQEHYSVTPLFNQPDSQRGRLVELSGTARRIEEIILDQSDPDIVARFGFDRYYQVSMFTDDSQGNPITFCVRDLPQGMPFGNLPRYGESVRIAGFFFKTWSYPAPKLTDSTLQPGGVQNRIQYSPLLIGRSLEWYPIVKPADNTQSGLVFGGICLAVMAIVWAAAWRNRLRERKWLDKRISKDTIEGPD